MSIAPISQFFILSPRGDTIISKDYRGDAVAGTTDTFFRKASPKIKSMSGRVVEHFAVTRKAEGSHLLLQFSEQQPKRSLSPILPKLAQLFRHPSTNLEPSHLAVAC